MTRPHLLFLIGGLSALWIMLTLLRRQQLREKYAVLWLCAGVVVMVLGVFPGLIDRLARWLGVADPPNLLFFGALLFLLVVVVHLSWEVSRLEDETRTLAEELGLLRLDAEEREERLDR